MRTATHILLLLALFGLGACSAESPFSLQGKPKLAGRRCAAELCTATLAGESGVTATERSLR